MKVAIYGDSLLDLGTGETIPNPVVVVEDQRIVAVGDRATTSVSRDAESVDASGLTLLPGLIDCHVHLRSKGTGRDAADWLATPPSLWLLGTVPHAAKTLDAGFTTIREAGGSPAGLKMAIERGYFPGPRMLVTLTEISQTGGNTDQHYGCGADLAIRLPDIPPAVVDGVEPMRLRVRELIRAGADWIKLCTTGGILTPNDDPKNPTLTFEEISAAVQEAAAQGRKVMCHAQSSQGVKNALRAGAATIEHGFWLDDDSIEMLLNGHNALVPTLIAPIWIVRHAEAGRIPPWGAAKGREVVDDHKASIRRAIEAGVTIAFGTDTGVGPHGSMGEEFLVMHELGLSTLDCLRSATTIAAETIGLGGRVGTLSQGAFGDVIGVPGDPLADLNVVAKPENVQLVIKGGEVMKDLRIGQRVAG